MTHLSRPLTHTEVLDATQLGASPAHPHVQQELFPDPVISGDNPLNLNIYAPADTSRPHPIMLWLYGGGFFTGSNASPWYAGESFARDGVVFVVPNYRLAAEGFMILDDGIANRAILDLTLALQWVHDNIAQFGGDPTQVTIAGQSAGATAALTLLGAPAARGLFHRVAAMSPGTPFLTSLERMQTLSQDFADLLGVPATRAALNHIPLSRRMAREVDWLPDEVRAAPTDIHERARRAGRGTLRWQPTQDGTIITTSPAEALCAPAGIDAVLIGTTNQEWNFLLGDLSTAPSLEACIEGAANLGMTPNHLRDYMETLHTTNPGQALTDHRFRAPVRNLAETSTGNGARVHAYQFAWPSPAFGAARCTDLPFAFRHLNEPGVDTTVLGPEPPAAVATALHAALIKFAEHGRPGWDPYHHDRSVMVFNEHSYVHPDALKQAPRELLQHYT